MDENNDNSNDDNADDSDLPHIYFTQMSNAIANKLVSSRQHSIPIFSGSKGEDPIKFLRIFESRKSFEIG
jgi:hypothetical protein